MISCLAFSQSAPKPYGVLPTQRQLNWQETEMYCLIHFSMATLDDKEWGFGDEAPAKFNPSGFDAKKIVGAAKAGGFKGIIVVAKHHDGFCLWPTKTTQHNISHSPFRNGQGDMLKEYQLACKELGMKMGTYLSPWDRNNTEYGKPGYVEIYRAQLKELLSNYGSLFMSWHDGANGGDGFYGGAREQRRIDRSKYYGWDSIWSIIRRYQPGAAIFGDVGPDVRWVGNEDGYAGETSWQTYTPQPLEEGTIPANGFVKDWLGTNGTRNGKFWMPAECDVPLRTGWFYHPSQDGQSKGAYKLLDLYYKSVGRASCLDLGLSPDKEGRLSEEDEKILKQFGEILKQTFAVNLAKGAAMTATNVRGKNQVLYGAAHLTDNDRYSYWATDDAITNPTLIADLHSPKTFNVIRLRENIKLGQRIEGAEVDAWQDNKWQLVASVTSIGANRLVRLPQNITTSKVRIRITGSPVCIALSDLGLFKEPVHLSAPRIGRNREGEVIIGTEAPVGSIRYTTDGKTPDLSSPRYLQPFELRDGAYVKAVSYEGDRTHSEISSIEFGPAKNRWQVMGDSGNKSLVNIIDEDKTTFAELPAGTGTGIIVKLDTLYDIRGFTYLPYAGRHSEGIVDSYEFDYSTDGIIWIRIAEGEFSNIKANPVLQNVVFNKVVSAGYFRFIPKRIITGTNSHDNVNGPSVPRAKVAELGIMVPVKNGG